VKGSRAPRGNGSLRRTIWISGARRNYEMKWAGPDGAVFDISHTGWDGTS